MTSTTPTLTDRYVQAVLGGVPSGDRPELEREIRALIADTIDAKAADGTLDADAAERAALTELGDPGALATRYTSGRDRLPARADVYPVWRGIITVLLGVLVPTLGVLVLTVSLFDRVDAGHGHRRRHRDRVQVAVQTLFWFTLVFAIIDRVGGPKERAELATASVAGRTPVGFATPGTDRGPRRPARPPRARGG